MAALMIVSYFVLTVGFGDPVRAKEYLDLHGRQAELQGKVDGV